MVLNDDLKQTTKARRVQENLTFSFDYNYLKECNHDVENFFSLLFVQSTAYLLYKRFSYSKYLLCLAIRKNFLVKI